MRNLLPAALALATLSGCAAAEKELEAVASNPNTVATVTSLVEGAGTLLEQAIGSAESGAMRVLTADPNGNVLERDIAAELRAVKDTLDGVALPPKS